MCRGFLYARLVLASFVTGSHGSNKRLKGPIAKLTSRIQAHEDKKIREREKTSPDLGLIQHWESEIESWKQQIVKAKKRLSRPR